jgi:hypothetical protein
MPVEEILNEIYSLLPETETILSSAFVKLYTSDQKSKRWIDSRLSGILLLIINRGLSAVLLRLYDLSKLEMTFETELYYNFSKTYTSLSDLFHYFLIPGGQVGLSFARYEQSKDFQNKINIYSPQEKLLKPISKVESSQNTKWIHSFKSALSLKKADKSKAKIEISKPYAVQLVSRVDWDKEKDDFILDSLPLELRKIFTFNMELKGSHERFSVRSPGDPSEHSSVVHRNTFNQSSRNSKEVESPPRRKMKIKVYKASPERSVDKKNTKNFELREKVVENKETKKSEGFSERSDEKEVKKFRIKSAEPNRKEENLKKSEKQKSYAQLYRDLLKQGVANRHRNMNLYGNSEFSSESSLSSKK